VNARQRIRRIQRWLAAAKRDRVDEDCHMPDVEYMHEIRDMSTDDHDDELSFERRMKCNRLFAAELAWLAQFAIGTIDDETLDDYGPGRCEECGRAPLVPPGWDSNLCQNCYDREFAMTGPGFE
jgi:hypothetical protein